MTINHNTLPQFDIDLSQIKDACEIKGIMKKVGVLDYVYAFINGTSIMKYGQSSYKGQRNPYGERIYRQARYISGWQKSPKTKNSSGSDFLKVLEYFPNVDKNQVRIHVWDLTGYNFAVEHDHSYELTSVENQLIENYKHIYGIIPVGNIKDESYIKSKTRVVDAVFSNLFEEAK